MKARKIISISLILILFFIAGCSTGSETTQATQSRFKIVSSEIIMSNIQRNESVDILVDTQTNVLYMKTTDDTSKGAGVGLTVLVDADGKPLLYQP